MLKNKYQNDINNFNLRIEAINKELYNIKEKENNATNDKSVLEKYTHIDKLDRMIVEEFISKILIGKKDKENNRPIKIFWNFAI